MNNSFVPLLCAVAALPLVLETSVLAQASGKGQAHLVAFQDPDPDSGAIDESSADYDVFYDRLSSDGNWFYDDDYGYVWQPNVAVSTSSWRPYADGHWVWTDRGWCWVSNEDFGWATYHYGRWIRISGAGWVWVPGDEWAPAWVSWRHTDDDDYVGWAPLPPESSVDVSVGVNSWCDTYYDIGPAAFAFIRIGDFCRPSYREFFLPAQENFTIINRTRNITNITYNNNVFYNYGPQYERVSQFVQRQGQQVPNYRINYTPQLDPKANFRTQAQGKQLNIVAPPEKLKAAATKQPPVSKQLGKAQVDRGWQNVPANQAQQIRQKFVQEAPVPKTLPPKAPLPAKPQIQAAKTNQPGQPGKPATMTPGSPAPPKTATETGPNKTQNGPAGKHPAPGTTAGPGPAQNPQKASKPQPAPHPQPQQQVATHPHPASHPQPQQHAAAHPQPASQPQPQQHAAAHHQPAPHPQPQQHAAAHPQPAPHPQPQQHAAAHPPPAPHPQPQQHAAAHPQPHPQPQKADNKKKEHQG